MEKRLTAKAVWVRAMRALMLLVVGAGLTLSVLGSPADLARGLAWLQAQVLSDGSLAPASRVGAQEQASCEVAKTLAKLAGNSSQISALLATLPGADKATETLGCWQQLRTQLGQTVLASELDAREVPGQAWSPYEDFGVTSAVDTGPALVAQLLILPAADKMAVLAWLQSQQADDGSFASGGRPDLIATATVLRGLQVEASKSTTAAAIATKAAAWLLGKRDANGQWLADVAITSLVYEAVHPYTGADTTVASSVESYLLALQLSDGSWAGDPYVTALALRALALTAVTPVDPTAGTSATVRGVVRDSSGQLLAGVTVQVQPTSGPVKAALTDAAGKYQIGGVAPGSMSVVASLAGYQSATGQATVAAGTYTDFSPTLYPTGTTIPGTAHLRGVVMAFGSGTPLPGVTVQASGTTPVSSNTDPQGAFDLTLASGTYTVTYSLTGYVTLTQQLVLPAGAVADAGNVLLQPVPVVSTLHGTISDLQGTPVAGASVSVQGGPSTTSGSSGAYSLDGVNGLQFVLQASATGYSTRSMSVSLSQPGDYVQDIKLPSVSAAYLALSDVTLSPSTVGLRSNITASFTVSNPSGSPASAVVNGRILDAQGGLLATVAGVNPSGQALGELTLQPGESQDVALKWNTGLAAPGDYALAALLQEPGSVTRDAPLGIVLDSRQRAFAVTAGSSFIGSITADPPVLRAGTNTAIKLSALIQNDGNVTLPAQDYMLVAIDTKSGQIAMTQKVTSEELSVRQLRSLTFADWTPQIGGDFRLELTASSVPSAKVTAPLYVGDSGSATFTLDRNQVPAGDEKVRASITVTGQSVASGTINDPLVPLVKSAITRAVNAADKYGVNHYTSTTLRCFACHVQTQAVVGGERNLKYLTPANPLLRTVLMTAVTQNLGNDSDTSLTAGGPMSAAGPVLYRDNPPYHKITNTTLGLWAATQWHDASVMSYSEVRMANFLLNAQSSNGSWVPDHTYTWWRTPAPLAALNAASLSALKTAMQGQTIGGKKLVPIPVTGLPSATWRLATDSSGTLYAASSTRGVYRIPIEGGPAVQLSSRSANAVLPLPDGRMLIGNTNGMWVRQISGSETLVGSGWPVSDLSFMADGTILMTTPWWDGAKTLYRVTPEGGITAFAASALLANKSGTAAMPDGTVMTAIGSTALAYRFGPGGNVVDSPLPVLPQAAVPNAAQAMTMRPYLGGLILATEHGLFYYDKNWIGQRWSRDWVYGPAVTPDGRLFVNGGSGSGISEVKDDTPFDTAAITARIDASVSKTADWLKAGIGIDNNNNIDVAFRLMGLGAVKRHFKGTSRETEFDALMQSLGSTLRARQKAGGGWIWREGTDLVTKIDPMITAMVGIALDNLNPSKDSPEVRNAITYLLQAQAQTQPDQDLWHSAYPGGTSGVGLADGPLLPSTWVEMWLPTMLERLGGIDTDVSVTFPPNVVMSNPDKTPATTTVGADGLTTYVWKLTGVTETSQQINFDATLKGMQVDETRAVAQSASLVFKNTFVDGTVTAQIDVPKVSVGSSVTQLLSTDKPSYTDAEQAVFTSAVTNTGSAARDVQVRFTVFDSLGQVVDVLPLTPVAAVPAAKSLPVQATWPASGVLAGAYQLKSEVLSSAGVLYSTATTNFNVTSSGLQSDGARIGTDRASYTAAQTVQVTSRVSNLTTNTAQDNLQAVTVVSDSGNASVFGKTQAIEQLAPSTQRSFDYSLAGIALPPGTYQASVKLLDAQGHVLAQNNTSFTVLGTDQTGVGLTGGVTAPPSVLIGQPAAIGLNATNGGSAALTNVPLKVRVIDPPSGSVLASFTQTVASWPAGNTQTMGWNWPAQGLDGQTVVAAATASIAGREVPIGQASIVLVGVPKLAAQPPQLEFAAIYAGETSLVQTVTVSSVGTAAAHSMTTVLSGMDPSQFVITHNACDPTASLAIGASCTFAVKYQPTAVAQHAAQAKVSYAGGEDLIVPLSGQAKPAIFTGTVGADPNPVEAGMPASLSYSLTNPAAASEPVSALLKVDDAAGQTLASWPIEATVGAKATTAGNRTFSAPVDPQILSVNLSQVLGTSTIALAGTSLTVIDPPIPVATTGGSKGQARILVLVSCPPGLGTAEDAACVQARSQAITSYLTALGYTNKVVSTGEDFLAQMRCGSFNTYWISGGAIKLSEQTAEELREAIWRGESLWTDGLHDSRNSLLYGAQGVTQIGKLPVADHAASLAEPGIYGNASFATLGTVTKFQLTTGQAQGQFMQVPGEQLPVPAGVANRWGQGNSLLFAFDLAAMITQDAGRTNAQLANFVVASAGYAAGASETLTIGDLTQLELGVTNQSTRTVTMQVLATLPAGLASIGTAPNAQLATNTDGSVQATWTYASAPGSTQVIDWLVRAQQPGSYSIPYQVFSLPLPGSIAPPKLRASGSVDVLVKDAAGLLQQAQAQVGALQPTASNDKSNLTKAQGAVSAALTYYGQGNYEAAIVQWLAAADAIAAITSVDTGAARTAVSMALEASTDAACIQKCGSASCQ